MDNSTPQTEELQTQTVETSPAENTETPKTDLPKLLREQLKKQNEENKKLQSQLEAITKAEEDKTKSAEEKLAEKDLKLKDLESLLSKKELNFNLEKKLLSEKINPELQDLILSKAKDLVNDTTSIDEVVESLKSQYPTAFLADNETKPIPGKVGLSATTGATQNTMTKEKAIEILNSGNNKMYLENEKEITKAILGN